METETRVATIAMIIENDENIAQVNELLHQYNKYIIGRMGIPYRERGLNIINVVLDAPNDAISALSGKLGRLNGVTSKAVYSKQTGGEGWSPCPVYRTKEKGRKQTNEHLKTCKGHTCRYTLYGYAGRLLRRKQLISRGK